MVRTKWWEPLAYMAPTLIVVLIVFLYPVLRVFHLSTMRPFGSEEVYVGLDNFKVLFSDPVFHQALLNSLRLLVIIPILVPLGVIIAALLYEQMRGWQVYRSVVFFPYVIAIAVSGIVWSYFLRLNGPMNAILEAIGLDFLALDWLGKPLLALASIMIVIIWRELGFGVTLCLARLMSLSEELIEAAKLDGASWHQSLWYVIVPQLMPVIEFWVIILIITVLAWVFDYVFVMTQGGPGASTFVVDFFVYVRAFRDRVMGIAAAASVVLFIVSLVLMYLRHRLSSLAEIE
jgi:ABC-type sugar transport system permease subunit